MIVRSQDRIIGRISQTTRTRRYQMKKFVLGLCLSMSAASFACTAYVVPQGEGEVNNFASTIYAQEIHQHLISTLVQKGYSLADRAKHARFLFENVVTVCAQDVAANEICPHAFAVLDYATENSSGDPDAGSYTGESSSSMISQIAQRTAAYEAIESISECHN